MLGDQERTAVKSAVRASLKASVTKSTSRRLEIVTASPAVASPPQCRKASRRVVDLKSCPSTQLCRHEWLTRSARILARPFDRRPMNAPRTTISSFCSLCWLSAPPIARTCALRPPTLDLRLASVCMEQCQFPRQTWASPRSDEVAPPAPVRGGVGLRVARGPEYVHQVHHHDLTRCHQTMSVGEPIR